MNNDKMLGLVAAIDLDDFMRSRLFACIYCGDTTQKTRDHVISVAWSGHKRNYKEYSSIIIAFKFEKGIPFDYSLTKYFYLLNKSRKDKLKLG